MQSTFRRETRPDRVPLLLSSVSDSECFPFRRRTVRISPRASNTARCPVGEISRIQILSAAFIQCARGAGRSPFTRTSMCSRCPTLGPKDTIRPIASYTRASGPAENRLQIPAPCFDHLLHRFGFGVISKQAHWPVPVRKKINRVSNHTGFASFEFSRGIFTSCKSRSDTI